MQIQRQLREMLGKIGPSWRSRQEYRKRVAAYFTLLFPSTQIVVNLSPQTWDLALAFRTTKDKRSSCRVVAGELNGNNLRLLGRIVALGDILVLSDELPAEPDRETITASISRLGAKVIGFAAISGWTRRGVQPSCQTIFDS